MWCWRRMEKISWTDHVRKEEVLLRVHEHRNILHEIRKRKANWTGHILRRNCLLKQVIEGKIKGEMEVKRRRGRRRKKLLDDLKDRRWYSYLKEEALDRTIWRNRFGGGFGPVVRQNTEWMNESGRRHYGPGVDSVSDRNEYQEYILGVKAAGVYGWKTYTFMCRLSWNLEASTSWDPRGLSRPVEELLYLLLYTVFIYLVPSHILISFSVFGCRTTWLYGLHTYISLRKSRRIWAINNKMDVKKTLWRCELGWTCP